jgi:uncharacterized protein YhaN
MRFSELHLIKYGQFDGCRLAFPKGALDLQIVFGPNEAGKSTTMAAVGDLLFSFPHSTSFDFRFDKTLLRVGASIESDHGPMTFRRKKGNVRTLLDESEQPIDEGLLTRLLAGQTAETFQRMFSLDHTRLREGGQAILDAKDDVGQAIFAAGSGLVGVVRLAEALEEEAKAIWTERASSSRTYYVAQKAFEEARSRLKESQIKSSLWAEQKRALETAESKLKSQRVRRAELQTERQAIERRRRVLTPIARRSHALGELEALGPTPEMPLDATGTVQAVLAKIAEAETGQKLASAQAEAAQSELAALSFDPALLEKKAAIDGLHAQRGAIEKAKRDAPSLKGRAQAAGMELDRLQQEIGWPLEPATEALGRLPGRPQVAEVRELLEQRSGIDAAIAGAEASLASEEEALEALAQSDAVSQELVDDRPLAAALQFARAQGDIDGNLRRADLKRQKSAAALSAALAALSPWKGDAKALVEVSLPTEAMVAEYAGNLRKAGERLDQEVAALRKAEEDHARLKFDRDHLVEDEHAVSAEMLATARLVRDEVWTGLRGHLLGDVRVADPAGTADRFEGEATKADGLADRRFEAAETSASLLGLDRELGRLSLVIEQTRERNAGAQTETSAAEARWATATASIGPDLTPTEFESWRSRRARALELAESLRSDEADLADLWALEAKVKVALTKVLPPKVLAAQGDETTLAGLLSSAAQLEAKSQEARELNATREAQLTSAKTAAARAGKRLDQAKDRLKDWLGLWAPVVRAAGLDPEASLTLVRARLASMDELRVVAGNIVGWEQRIVDMVRDSAGFEDEVKALAPSCGVTELERDSMLLLQDLEEALDHATKLAERARGLNDRIDDAKRRDEAAGLAISAGEATLDPLLRAASVIHRDELPAVIARAELARGLRHQIDELTQSIIVAGDGLTLEALLTEADGADAAALTAASENLQEEIDELAEEIERLAEERRDALISFQKADDRPEAAVAASDVSQARAEMEAQAEAYVRKRAEAKLLSWAIERYRREKQAPLLQRASAIFKILTLGRYASLSVEVDAGKPRLSGVSADGATVVPITGMSEGAVDQLYLSLRLAAVEESIANGVRLPFLADDLFINYDDERAAAGFRVLAELATKTQVLFFTHHEHLIDIAESAVAPACVSTCRMGDRSIAA